MVANTSIPQAQLVPDSRTRGQWTIGTFALVGGGLIIIGTLLPWFSLFAGLQSYAGIIGFNGRLLLAGGVLSALMGIGFLMRRTPPFRWAIGLFGFVLLAATSVLVVQLLQTYRDLAADPLMVAALGPGLFVVLVGALLIFCTLFIKHT